MTRKILSKITLHSSLLLLILLVAIANRFYGLDRLSLWADELWVVMASSKGSLSDMFGFIYWQDNHPPGHYVFMRYWQVLFGDSDYVIRFPFAVSGIFLVYSVYASGRKYYSVEAALVAAALVSGSWQAIYYSQEARANIMVAVSVLWSLHYFYHLVFVQTPKTWDSASPFWLWATLTCYLHYVGTVFVASLGLLLLVMLLVQRQKQLLLTGMFLFLPIAILYLPWLHGTYYRLTHAPQGAWWQTPEWSFLYENFKWIFGFGSRILILYQITFILLIFFAGLFLIKREAVVRWLKPVLAAAVQDVPRALHFSSVLCFILVVPVMIFFIKSKISQPVYDYRHFLYVLPLLAMPTGFLVNLLFVHFRNWIRGVILVLVVVLLIVIQNVSNILGKLYLGPHFKAEYRQSVEILTHAERSMNDKSALIISSNPFFDHYLQRSLNGRSADYFLYSADQIPALKTLIADHNPRQFYFLELPTSGGRSLISKEDLELIKSYKLICRTTFIYAQVLKFENTAGQPIDWDKLPACN